MSEFIKVINSAYKNVLLEQGPDMMGAPMPAAPGGAPMPPAPGPGGMEPGIPSTPPTTPTEPPVNEPAARSSSDAFLIGLICKALLVDVDDDDKLKIIKYLKKLDETSASEVEENVVNMINLYDYQNVDEDLFTTDLNISPKRSRKLLKFVNNIMQNYVETDTAS